MGPGRAATEADGIGYADYAALSEQDRTLAETTIGIPQQVSAAGAVEALPIAERWMSELADAVEQDKLKAWGQRITSDPEYAALMYRTLLTADMGGQLVVRTVEVPESAPRSTALARVEGEAFFTMRFEEAIASFLARKVITPAEYRRLSAEARARAFSVSRMTSDELVRRVQAELQRTLDNGGSLRTFTAAIRADEVSLGIEPTSPSYLENIFRTNTQTAYGAGRLRQITNPIVMATRPYIQYRTAGDNRVRESHKLLDRVIFRQEDPDWRKYAPPLGFQCRCSLVTLRESQVDLTRVVAANTLTVEPDPGFGNPRM